MPRSYSQGDPPKEFAPVPEGWYFGKIVDVKETDLPRGNGIRLGFAFEITEGEWAKRWVWCNVFVSEFIIDNKTGEKITPSNYRIRKLQADIDPIGHVLDDTAKAFSLEDHEWFMNKELAIQVVHRAYVKKDGEPGLSIEVKQFCHVDNYEPSATPTETPAESPPDVPVTSPGDAAPGPADNEDEDLPF